MLCWEVEWIDWTLHFVNQLGWQYTRKPDLCGFAYNFNEPKISALHLCHKVMLLNSAYIFY